MTGQHHLTDFEAQSLVIGLKSLQVGVEGEQCPVGGLPVFASVIFDPLMQGLGRVFFFGVLVFKPHHPVKFVGIDCHIGTWM